jgi:hypothetical protein
MEVLLYPYLPLVERHRAGPWELIPTADLLDEDAHTPDRAELIRRLVRMYRLPENTQGLGALARKHDGKVGDEIDRRGMQLLRRAVLLAILDANPSFLTPEGDRTGNEGHAAVTSDNAVGYGHPIEDDGYIAVEYGALATTLVGGLNVNEQEGRIPAPVELRAPMLTPSMERYYLASVYAYCEADTPESRRVLRAIDWLDLAWRNTVSLNLELRIVALKTALEVLLDSDQLEILRARLAELMDPADAQRRERTWRTLSGREIRMELSDLEWWFTQFTFLRNKIAHGDEIHQADFDFEDRNHLWLAEARLREAINEVIARAGYPDVRLERGVRVIRNAYRQAGFDPDTGLIQNS